MTDTAAGVDDLEWSAPGPGSWRRELNHFPTPPTAHLCAMFPAIVEGFRYTTDRFGFLFDAFSMETVNGILYASVVPLEPSAFASRVETAAAVFATRSWRADVGRWDAEVKPRTIREHRSMIDVEPPSLRDDDLVAHLARCHDHHYAMWRQHHQFNGAHWIPVGDFVTSTVEWTGLPAAQVAMLLRGASPISRGHCPEGESLAAAIESSREATAVVDDDSADPASVIATLAAMDGRVGASMRDWLAITGYRLIDGFDICFPTALERPELLLASLRAARAEQPSPEDEELLARVRDAVPDEHRDEFDERYAEARYAFHVRDERGIFSDAIAAGLVRRAWLAAGERLVSSGVLSRPELAIDATAAELQAALVAPERSAGLDDELAARAMFRSIGIPDAPMVLGAEPSPPPPLDGLPPDVARVVRALVGISDDLGKGSPDPDRTNQLVGIGASPGVQRGTARIVRSPDDLDRLDEGSVMITVTTGEAFNVAISLVTALVTEVGGVLSHAGITAREFGIPAVVNVTGATTQIPDGATVEIDGTNGLVHWVARADSA